MEKPKYKIGDVVIYKSWGFFQQGVVRCATYFPEYEYVESKSGWRYYVSTRQNSWGVKGRWEEELLSTNKS